MMTDSSDPKDTANETGANPYLESARLAHRLMQIRQNSGKSLEDVAAQTGVTRSTLSRIERGETSPNAITLCALSACYGLTLSQILAPLEQDEPRLLRHADMALWQDPDTSYIRRTISPPAHGYAIEMLEVHLPPGAEVGHDQPAWSAMEEHIYVIEGCLEVGIGADTFHLNQGDCLRMKLYGRHHLANRTDVPARYIISIARKGA